MNNCYISSLSFKNFNLAKSLRLIKDIGYKGVEIAPMKFFSNWEVSDAEISNLNSILDSHELAPISLVSIFYNSGLTSLVTDFNSRLLNYHLKRVKSVALRLNVSNIIIGAPSLRTCPANFSQNREKQIINHICNLLDPLDVCFEIINYEKFPLILDDYETYISSYQFHKPENLKICLDSLTFENIISKNDTVINDTLLESIKMIQLHLRPNSIEADIDLAIKTLKMLKNNKIEAPISIEMQNLVDDDIINISKFYVKRVLNEYI